MSLPTLSVLINGTDVTAYVLLVNGYSLSRGREDWQGAVTAGELSLTLNNSDGRFTPGAVAAGGGFDSLPFGMGGFGGGSTSIAVDASIVLRETVNGVTYTRFTGYVKSWPISWPATVATFSTVQITATDAQARAERRTLRSMLVEEILLTSPATYYTLSEGEGSTAAGNTSGSVSPSLPIAGTGTAPTFGTGTAADGQPAVQLFGGKYLAVGTGAKTSVSTPTSFTMTVTFNTTTPPAVEAAMAYSNGWTLGMVTGGLVYAIGPGSVSAAGANYADGRTHTAFVRGNGGSVEVYVDGALISTASYNSDPNADRVTRDYVGVGSAWEGSPPGGLLSDQTPTFTGTLSHFASWNTSLTVTQIQGLSAIATGAAETSTARITRLANEAAIPVGTLDASLTTIPAQATSGQSAMSAIQDVTDAELGVAYINGAGNLTFHNRNRVVLKAAPDLTLDHQWITPDVQPVVDDQQIVNYFEGSSQSTGAVQVARNAASETAHGRYPTSQSYLVRTDAEALDRASWTVANFAEPSARYGTLTINLYAMTPAMQSQVLAAIDLDCWLRVTSMASQTPGGTTVDVVVQGFSENQSADTWTLTCNVVSHALYTPAWILDTSKLDDTAALLYV